MAEFSRDELRNLIAEQVPPCVSIYMPSDQPGTMAPLNHIRFKTLLNQAEERLRSLNTEKPEVVSMLAPAHELLEDRDFWLEQREGLVVFLSASPQAFRYFADNSVAVQFPEMAKVANQFHLKPLLPLLFGDGQFYVLALSRHHAGLLRGTRDTIQPVELKGVPQNIFEALGQEVSAPQIQGRPMNVGGGEQTGVFGGYNPKEYDKDRVLRYFREVDHGLHHILGGQNVPLVVAGVEYLHALYREANSYPHLLDEGIMIDAENLSARELHRLAWPIVEPAFRQDRTDAVNRYRQLLGRGLSSNKLADILPAAHYGRIETLFVAAGVQQFGIYDAQNNQLEAHTESRPGNSDLLDEAATQTVLNGGTIYVVPPQEMPDPVSMVNAIFRY